MSFSVAMGTAVWVNCSVDNDSSFKEKIASIFQRLNSGTGK